MAALFGLFLILVGVLVMAYPPALSILVGTTFMVAGVGAVLMGWRLRSAVTYRRIDTSVDADE